METMMWMLIPIALFSALMLVMIMRKGNQKYDVFQIEGDKLFLQTLWRPSFKLDEIESIEFSKIQRVNNFLGCIQIIKYNGSKSRKYRFDSSYLQRKIVFNNSEDEIDFATEKLMAELRKYGIRCSKIA